MTDTSLDTYRHFNLHRLAEGVYATTHKEGGASYCNAGIIDLGEQTLIFDTLDMPSAAVELRRAAEELTGRRASWVVNSHKHGDHWGGNQVFAGESVIVSTAQTRQQMAPLFEEIEQMKANLHEVEEHIRELEDQLRSETDPLRRATYEYILVHESHMLENLPLFKGCLPDQTFESRLTFHGTQRTAELRVAAPAHTPSDCYLILPAEKIIFTGDLAFFDCPPFMAEDCDLNGWQAQLKQFAESSAETFVPGHGPIGKKANLAMQLNYFATMQALVAQAVQAGQSLEEILQLPLPEPFAAWGAYSWRIESNFRALYRQSRRELA